MAAVQSRVAAPVVSGPRAPPPTSAFSAFHDGSYWCSKCPRRGFQSAKGLMMHITRHPRARSLMRTPALCSGPLSASPARLPHAAASDDLVRVCAIGVHRPPEHNLQPSVTLSWAPRRAHSRRLCGLRRGWHRCEEKENLTRAKELFPTFWVTSS